MRSPTPSPSPTHDSTPSTRFPTKTDRLQANKPFINLVAFYTQLPAPLRTKAYLYALSMPDKTGGRAYQKLSLTIRHNTGLTITQNWTTASLLDTKLELADVVAPGVKLDVQNLWNPSKQNSAAQKITAAIKKPNVHSRAFVNYGTASGNIDTVVDAVVGMNEFLVGGEAGYDVQKAAVTRYSLGLGYQAPSFSASVNMIQNLSVVSATYYQKVNGLVEVGAKAGYDVNAAKASGLELAGKYKLDPLSFAKAKINDRGTLALAYSTKLNIGTTLGLGLSLDTNKLNEAGHKVGTSLTFEG